MKRFTETTKWGDPWYQDLSPEFKLIWMYLCDTCDSSGVWKVNARLAQFQLGFEYPIDRVLELFGKRIYVLTPEKWFIPSFIRFQYGELSEDCRPHKPILDLIRTHNLENLLEGYSKGTGRAKDKKRIRKGSVDEGESEGKHEHIPEFLRTTAFVETWTRWAKHRREIKKPLTEEMEQSAFRRLAPLGVVRAVEIVEYTLAKGWQGLADDDKVPVRRSGVNLTTHDVEDCRNAK